MSGRDQITVRSTRDVEKQLDQLAENIKHKALVSAMNKVLDPAVAVAKAHAPDRTGTTEQAITKKVKQYPSGTVVGLVGADAAVITTFHGKRHWPVKIFAFLEGGTQSHLQPHRGKGVVHPGAKARPMIGPARDALGDAAADVFAAAVQAQVDKLQARATP